MKIEGIVHRFGNHINTDYIISSKYKYKASSIEEMTSYIFEDIDPEFADKVSPGDLIVAGENFGSGSSRETAPRVLKAAGISCVIARSFSRIFFRNAINIGLPIMICSTDSIIDGEILEVNLEEGFVKRNNGDRINGHPLPNVMVKIIQDGGLKNHIIKHNGYALR